MAQGQNRSENTHGLLFLTDEQLRKGIEAMFFAYRGFTADPDRILAGKILWASASPGAAFHPAQPWHNRQQFIVHAWRDQTKPQPRAADLDRRWFGA